MRRLHKIHSLKKPRVRQDWSKESLYNLSRLTNPPFTFRTLFQQKWMAKSLARGYHNPYLQEGKWTKMFSRRIPAVVPMNHRYLAQTDGSEEARGRGSGIENVNERQQVEKTPYTHMAFAPLERRLDTAIWRALFASSVRQARQFVLHGRVRVNGKRMRHPGYRLNPGDMFQVDPEMVMYATGAQKVKTSSPTSIKHKRERREAIKADGEAEVEEVKPLSEEEVQTDPKKALKSLAERAKNILEENKRELSGKRQQELRAFTQSVRKVMSKHGRASEEAKTQSVEQLETALAEIMAKVPRDGREEENKEYSARKEAQLLHDALQKARENPVDSSKPYATPWRPRDYMSAFAFIPRYLEVNQKVCSAVYLRHPVARPGLAEAPTPFSKDIMTLAFSWYLRRR
ncbi:putative 30S ribosomal subunit S4, partial [Piedraia hortae CBS 480.64]